ncbi:MAG: heparinase II/III family protein [Pirellulales bacterium]|nr:heparinase II/III family protein [Pirellulales bacterium]
MDRLANCFFAVFICLASFSGLFASAAESGFSPERVPAAGELIRKLAPAHPRLLIDQDGFERLAGQIQSDATLRTWDKAVRKEADALVSAPLPRHVLPDGKRLLSTSRTVLDRVYTLAMAYRLHGDQNHADRLFKELETVAAFPDFNPKHFLDTAEMTHALAIAYDWLYDTWTESQRATIRRAMVEMGLRPSLEIYRKGRWWSRATHNWNQVCNGGMTLGALAVGDEEPALAGEILRSAILSVPLAMESYGPDGAWGEGPGYWGYATGYNVVMLAALESALGTDFGLSRIPGFSQTGLFPIYTTGPSGRTFNFADSGDRLSRMEALLWLAERFEQPVLRWFAVHRGKPSAAAMVWYRPGVEDPAAASLPLDKSWRNVEVATLRSNWTDEATYVGIQAGSNQVNHNHLDLGSFVLDAVGQRWAVDLGGDNYNLPGYFGDKRYTYYRLRAEGHNTLVLHPAEGPDQDPKAAARIARFVSEPSRAFAVADLTPAYAKHADRVERGIALLDRRRVLLQDEVEARQPVDLWWFMHTAAAVQIGADGRGAVLEQEGKRLSVRLLAPADARFEVRPAEPLPSSPNPDGQRNNREYRKLAVHLPETKSLRLAVLFQPGDDAADVPVRPLAEW